MVVYLGVLHALGVYWAVHVALVADMTRAAMYAFGFCIYAVGGLASAVVSPIVQGNVFAARAAPADERLGEPGLGVPPFARPPHAPPVLEYYCGPAARAAGAHGLVVDPTGASCCRRWCPRALGQWHVEHVHGLRRDQVLHDTARDMA